MKKIKKFGGLFFEHDPYLLNKVVKVKARKLSKWKTSYVVYIEVKRGFTSGVIWRPETPNPWLRDLLAGKNPSLHWMENQTQKINSKKQVNLASKKHPIRWAGAGGMVVLVDTIGKKYVPLNLRPKDSLYGNCLDANGGLSSKIIDWLKIEDMGLREILEELIIVSKSKLLLPVKLENGSGREKDFESYIKPREFGRRQRKVLRSVIGENRQTVEFGKIRNVNPEKFQDEVSIHFQGQVYSSKGILVLDFLTAGLDLRNIYEIKIGRLDDLSIVDGETKPNNAAASRDRLILLVSLDDLLAAYRKGTGKLLPKLSFQSGKRVKNIEIMVNFKEKNSAEKIRTTPVLLKMLKVAAQND